MLCQEYLGRRTKIKQSRPMWLSMTEPPYFARCYDPSRHTAPRTTSKTQGDEPSTMIQACWHHEFITDARRTYFGRKAYGTFEPPSKHIRSELSSERIRLHNLNEDQDESMDLTTPVDPTVEEVGKEASRLLLNGYRRRRKTHTHRSLKRVSIEATLPEDFL